MKKALIIGGGGFVGRYLAEHIHLNRNWEIFVTKLENQELELPYATIFTLDILNEENVVSVLNEIQPDYIFHLAAQSSVAKSWEHPQKTVDINIKGSLNLLEAVRKLNYSPRVLLVGSGEEYGKIKEGECPLTEDNALRPGNIYAVTKVCQNLLGKVYADAYGLDIISVRAFNHVGPGQSETFVVSDFCKQVAEIEAGVREPVIYVGNLSAKRDFTDVRDIVKAYVLLALYGKSGCTYNVGRGEAISIQQILDAIIEKSRKKGIKVVVLEEKKRPVDVPIIEADTTCLKRDTNWEPNIAISDTLDGILEFWRSKFYADVE